MIRRSISTRQCAEHLSLHRDSGCTRKWRLRFARWVSWRTATVSAGRSKHLPGDSTSGANRGSVISSTARINGTIIIVISDRACAGRNPVGFSSTSHAAVTPDVEDDEEEFDLDGEDATVPKAYPNVQAPSAQETEEHQMTNLPFRCAGRPSSENGRTSRGKENRQSQHRLLFHGLARRVFRTPVKRARCVTHP